LDKTEYTARVAEVLIAEDVIFELDVLDVFVKTNYPDLRKCLNSCQQHSITNELVLPNANNMLNGENDYKLASIALFKNKEYTKARELICTHVGSAEMESFIKWTYDNLSLWGDTEEEINEAIRKIRDGAVNSSFIAEPEINVSGMIVDLISIRKNQND